MAAVFALLAAVGWGSSDYVGGRASRDSSAVSVVVLTHLASMLALAVIALVPGQTGSPTAADLGWGLAAGVGGGAGAMLLFRGLGRGSMSVVAPITAVGAASVPALAGLVQGESIGPLGIGGMLCALVAIVLVSLSADDDAGVDTDDRVDVDACVERVDVDEEIARLELEFDAPAPFDGPVVAGPGGATVPSAPALSTTLPAAVPPAAAPRSDGASLPSSSSSPWAAPTGRPVVAAAPRRTFRDLALEMHDRRDRFERALAGVAAVPSAHVSSMRTASSPAFPPPTSPPVSPLPAPGPAFASTGASVAVLPVPAVALAVGPDRATEPTTDRAAVQAGNVNPARPTGRRGGPAALLGRPGVVDALFSGIGFGLFFVFIARASEDAGHWPLVGARMISALMFAVIALVTTTAVLPERRARRGVVVAGLLDAGAAVCFVVATQSGLLSVGAVLASLYPAATVLLARFVDHERISRVQAGGLVLAGAAVSLLAL